MLPKISSLLLRPAPFVWPIKAASRKVVSDIYLINKAALRARNKGGKQSWPTSVGKFNKKVEILNKIRLRCPRRLGETLCFLLAKGEEQRNTS